MDCIVGIDTGRLGAIVVVFEDSTLSCLPHNKATFRERVQFLLDLRNAHSIRRLNIESVHAIFGSSAKATFTFGREYQRAIDSVDCAGIRPNFVSPKLWQKQHGIVVPKSVTGSKRKLELKKAIAAFILDKYPDAPIWGKRGGLLDGVSDALAIALYNPPLINK